ncbi:AAA family ATPase [Nocardioides pacificus]
MRLHQLEISAFGPFADTVEVDFDELSESGLFLLAGPTGAGKTSILDAVCFALYGDVPGDRSAARRLRCDTAPEGAAPRVVLDCTLGDRRFRITRSPAWERPKKRGTGTTTEQAKVLVEEHQGSQWVHLSSRNDEAGHLVTHLLGMNMSQFTQVAMLPQGQFQAFLRSRSEDRQKLLQKLFRTDRFADIERWLRDRRIELRKGCESHRAEVVAILGRISESADEPMPDEWDDALEQATEEGVVSAWAEELLDGAEAGHRELMEAMGAAVPAERAAREALEEGRRIVERRGRHARALAVLEDLDARADTAQEGRERLGRARRAAPVRPLIGLATQAVAGRQRAASAAEHARSESAALLGAFDVDAAAIEGACERARDRLADARALAPRETELRQARSELAAASARVESLEADERDVLLLVEQLPARVEQTRADLSAAVAAESRIAALESQRADLIKRREGCVLVARLEPAIEGAESALREAVDHTQALRERWLSLREARLEGMAAEIAGQLASGACCPVCGSDEHPHKAVPASGAPSERDEKQARRAHEDAEITRVAHEQQVRDLHTQLAGARAAAGDAPQSEVEAQLEEVVAVLEECRDTAARVAHLEAEAARLDAECTTARDRASSLGNELSALRSTRLSLEREVDRISRELAAAVAGTGHTSLSEVVAEFQAANDVLTDALRKMQELDQAETRVVETQESLVACATEHGFDDVDSAEQALLGQAECDALQRSLDAYDQERARVLAQLTDPELVEAAEADEPDLAGLTTAHAELAASLSALHSHAGVREARVRRLRTLVEELGAALATWAPARASYVVAEGVASFVEGKSADNRLKMRLSAYVLSYRLGQVVAAANVRLATMSDQRYALEHTHHKGAGETRGGLSLIVRDAWSGEQRDPVTLSGGETFVVSLALALGLADVVTQEAGGADLGTLFVDEGFGSLDPETLDDVMDTLDELRDGGRVVGVVSHVSEMRARIPVQLQVDKSRSGSSVRLMRSA